MDNKPQYVNIQIPLNTWQKLKQLHAAIGSTKLLLRDLVDDALTIYIDEKQKQGNKNGITKKV